MGKYEDYLEELKRKYSVDPNETSYMKILITMWKRGMMREEFDKLTKIWMDQYEERQNL